MQVLGFHPGWLLEPLEDPQPSTAWNLLGLDPSPPVDYFRETRGMGSQTSGLNKNQFCPQFKGRGRQERDMVFLGEKWGLAAHRLLLLFQPNGAHPETGGQDSFSHFCCSWIGPEAGVAGPMQKRSLWN